MIVAKKEVDLNVVFYCYHGLYDFEGSPNN